MAYTRLASIEGMVRVGPYFGDFVDVGNLYPSLCRTSWNDFYLIWKWLREDFEHHQELDISQVPDDKVVIYAKSFAPLLHKLVFKEDLNFDKLSLFKKTLN